MIISCIQLLYIYANVYFRFTTYSSAKSLLTPAEICDLLKASVILFCSSLMYYIDTNMMYHLIKSQSVIKLYLFYNILEVGDRLFSAFGQDTIDALYWTATEPRGRRREHFGVVPHLLFAIIYVCILLNIEITLYIQLSFSLGLFQSYYSVFNIALYYF